MTPAPPSTPLGMLQRGRGAGALWLLAAPREEAVAVLLRCLRSDTRRDGQVDAFYEWYADLVEALDLDLAHLEAHLEETGTDPDRRHAEQAASLAWSVLVELSKRPGPRAAEAGRILRGAVERGTAWRELLHFWVLSDPPPGSLDGLAERISARFPADAELEAAMDDFMLWPQWFHEGPLRHERLAAALPRSARFHVPGEPEVPADPAGLALRELLELSAGFHRRTLPGPLRREWARRVAPGDLRTLREAAGEDPDPRVRSRAIAALAARGEDVVEFVAAVLERDLLERSCAWVRGPLFGVLKGVSPESGLPFARTWLLAGNSARQQMAETLLEHHAELRDLPLIEKGVAASVRGEDSGDRCPCWAVGAIARLGGAAARPLLRALFEGTTCSIARMDAAERLAGLPGGLDPALALECLWDGSPALVRLGTGTVLLEFPGARECLRRLTASSDEELAGAAAARLAGLDPPEGDPGRSS